MKTNSKTMEGMEALRQIATNSLLIQGGDGVIGLDSDLQLQQSTSSGTRQAFTSSTSSNSIKRKGNNRVVPIIKEPVSILDGKDEIRSKFNSFRRKTIFHTGDSSYRRMFIQENTF